MARGRRPFDVPLGVRLRCTHRPHRVGAVPASPVPVAEVVRSGFVEGRHHGSVVAVAVNGSVTWSVGDAAGLRFAREFELGELAHSRPEVAASQWQRPSYLEAGNAGADDQWQHMSLGQLRQELEGFWKR